LNNAYTTPNGIGLEIEGSGNVCLECSISGWSVGLAASLLNLSQAADGLEISGGYFENNTSTHIKPGKATVAGAKIHRVSLQGIYFRISSGSNTACIDLEQADGFSIIGNQFLNCGSYNIYGYAGGTNQGGDNGIIANNSFNGSATNSLLGSNISLISGGQLTQINSKSNCSATSNPASCSTYASGTGFNSVTVNTSAVTAKSQIPPFVSAQTAGTSFNIAVTSAPPTKSSLLQLHHH
jgi:hypothetical protein